jgi:hypothetical protein
VPLLLRSAVVVAYAFTSGSIWSATSTGVENLRNQRCIVQLGPFGNKHGNDW